MAGGQQNRAPNDPNMNPTSTPKRLPEPKCRSEVLLDFMLNFSTDVKPFEYPNGLPKGIQNRLKFALRAPGPPKGLQGPPPEASREPFWPHFGSPGSSFSSLFRGFEEPQKRPRAPRDHPRCAQEQQKCEKCVLDSETIASGFKTRMSDLETTCFGRGDWCFR